MSCRAGAVYVERRPASAPTEDSVPAEPLMFNSQGAPQGKRPAGEEGPWGAYTDVEAVDRVMPWLNPQGKREGALKRVRLGFIPANGPFKHLIFLIST